MKATTLSLVIFLAVSCQKENVTPIVPANEESPLLSILDTNNEEVVMSTKGGGEGTSIKVNVAALLDGPIPTGGSQMSTDLASQGLIPLTDPYGTGQTATSINSAVVDWVLIELRDPIDPSIIVASKAGLLMAHTLVLSADYTQYIEFEGLSGSYYVAIRHRNHLGCMSTIALAPEGTNNIIGADFTNPTWPTYQDDTARKFVDQFYQARLWMGDANLSKSVNFQGPNNDPFSILIYVTSNCPGPVNTICGPTYDSNDLNMDGNVIYQGPNNDKGEISIKTIFLHPGNTSNLANFIAYEQLP